MYQKLAMRILAPFILAIAALMAIACAGELPTPTAAPTTTPVPTATPEPTPTQVPTATPVPTPVPTPTPTPAPTPTPTPEPTPTPTPTPQPSPTATPEPTPTPTPEPTSGKENLVEDFFDCLEGNLAVAGAFTATYDGPLSEQVHTVLNATGDVTSLMHDYGLFEEALLAAMDVSPLVAPSVLAINFGCSLISIDEPPETPEPTPTQPADSSSPKCQELALQIIEQSQDEDPADDHILEITGVEEIADSVLGLQCKGLSHTRSGKANWIEFHQNRLGRYRYEPLKLGDYECEYMAPQVIQMSQSRERVILEIYDIVEVERDDGKLTCLGTAETSAGESGIEFYAEESEDDKPTVRYDLISNG